MGEPCDEPQLDRWARLSRQLSAGLLRLCDVTAADWYGVKAVRAAVLEERPAVVAAVEVRSGAKGDKARAHAESVVGWGGV